jgi:hypothetical protein
MGGDNFHWSECCVRHEAQCPHSIFSVVAGFGCSTHAVCSSGLQRLGAGRRASCRNDPLSTLNRRRDPQCALTTQSRLRRSKLEVPPCDDAGRAPRTQPLRSARRTCGAEDDFHDAASGRPWSPVAQADSGVFCRANRPIIASLNWGMSSGLRLVVRFPSVTLASSTHSAPALSKSVSREGQDAIRRPFA